MNVLQLFYDLLIQMLENEIKQFALSSQQEMKLNQMAQHVNIPMLVLLIKQNKANPNPKLPSFRFVMCFKATVSYSQVLFYGI